MSAIYVNPEAPATQDPRFVDISAPGKKVPLLLARGGSCVGGMVALGGWTELDADDFLDAVVLEYIAAVGEDETQNVVIEIVHAKTGLVVRRQLGVQ
jgi:hypothetical protein